MRGEVTARGEVRDAAGPVGGGELIDGDATLMLTVLEGGMEGVANGVGTADEMALLVASDARTVAAEFC